MRLHLCAELFLSSGAVASGGGGGYSDAILACRLPQRSLRSFIPRGT
jgi:hypothetical protein